MKLFTKRALLTTALASAGVCAQAEGFGFYALLDGGIAANSISGPGTTTSKTEFVTGGYAPNFIGITGEKSMGNGFTGGFKLEQGFLLNKPPTTDSRFFFGNDSGLFNRQANLYITNSYGKFALGTQSNFAFDSVLVAEARFGSNFGSSLAAIAISGGLGTVDSGAVTYTSPSMSGFTVAAEYVPEYSTTTPSTAGKTIKSGTRLTATYGGGPLKGTVAVYSDDISGDTEKTSGTILGATYKLGNFDLKAMAVSQKNPTYSSLGTWGVGGAYSLSTATTIDFGIYKSSDSNTDYKMDTAAVGIQYKFLKDLAVYGQYAQVKNNGSVATPFNFAGPMITPLFITAGQTASTLNMGLLYSFF
jgi:predicted porin